MSGLSPRHEAHAAVVRAQESQARWEADERRRGGLGFDPGCRFAAVDPRHTCARNTGEPVRPGEMCHAEAHMQLREAHGVFTDGELLDAMAAAESPIPRSETVPYGEQAAGPVYVLIDPEAAAS